MARASARNRLKEAQDIQRLKESPLRPIYLLHGRERYFIRKCIRVIRDRMLTSPELQELLSHTFYGSETNADELLAVAQTPPFFQERQLILVREADKLKAPCQKKLLAYLDTTCPDTCMVFVAGEKVPKNKLFKRLLSLGPGSCLDFPALKKNQRKKWVEVLAEEKGLKGRLPSSLLSGFLEEGYLPLEVIETRLEILSLYLADGTGGKDTEDPLPPEWWDTALEQGYLLTDALLRGAEKECMVLLHRYVEQGTHPILILSRISWEMRRIERIREARERGEPLEGVFRSMRIPPFKQNVYLRLAGRIPGTVMAGIFHALLEKDRALKSSKLELTWHLEDLCRQILRGIKGP